MSTDVINHSVFVLVAGAPGAVTAPYAAQDVQHDARRKNCHKLFGLFFLVSVQIFEEENLASDVRIAHMLENGHAEPKPDVESGKGPAEVAAKLEALFPGCHCHFKRYRLIF